MASILKNYNYIKKLSTIPCGQPDWWVIIETGFKSAPPALLSLFLPGCNDIVKTRLGHAPWHGKTISAMIKNAIKPYPVSENKFLYKIGYFTAEKYLWWYMVADVTTDFVTNWQSMVYQQQQCELPGAGTASGIFTPFVYGPDQSGKLAWSVTHPRFGVLQTANGIGIRPGFEANIAYSVEWDSWPERGMGADVETSLQEIGNPDIQDIMNTNNPLLKNGPWTQGSTYHQKIGSVVITEYAVNFHNNSGNFVQPVASSFSIGLSGRNAGGITWGCKPKPVEWPFPNPLDFLNGEC